MSKGEPSSGSSPRRFDNILLRDLLILSCIIVVVLCAAEFLLRAIDFTERRIESGKVTGAYRFDAEIGWSPKPNAVTQNISANRTVSVRQNSLGLRERELSDIAPDRILFLGDSFTWGFDAEVNERFTDLLQEALPQYGMVNAGVSGYGTDQQFLLMERLWNHVNPKVVVITFCVDNDRDDNSSSFRYQQQHKPYFVRTPEGELQVRGYPLPNFERNSSARGPWSERLALVRFAVDLYTRLRDREIIVPDPTEHLVDLIQRTLEARGVRLVVGLQRREPRLEAHLRARKIPHATLEDAPGYPTAGWHWTPEGNAIVARKYRALFAEIGIASELPQWSNLTAPARPGLDDRQLATPTTASVLSPSTWLAAAEALPNEFRGLGRFLQHWSFAVRDSHGVPRLVAALLILTVAVFALVALAVWWRLRVTVTGGEPSRFAKALRSFGVFLGLALSMPLAVLMLLEATEVRMIDITYACVAGVLVGEFGRAVAFGVLAPDDPRRRLITVNNATARSLSRHLVWAARGLGVLVMALAIHEALAAPPALTIATNTLFTLFICVLLLHLLWKHRHGGAAKAQPRLLTLGWLVVAAITIALVAGYPAVGSSIAARLVSTVAVSGMLYMLWTLGNELFAERLAVDNPRGLAIAGDFGVSARSLGIAAILTGIGMGLALLLGAFILYIGPW